LKGANSCPSRTSSMRQILLQKRKKGPHLWAVLKFLVYFII
jgi:hypothetical protein